MGIFAALMTLAGITVLVLAPTQALHKEELARGEVCASAAATGDDCLVRVSARITDRQGKLGGASRWHLEPLSAPGSVKDDWIRFDGNEQADARLDAVLAGEVTVQALYAGDDPVALEVDGERVVLLGAGPGSWRRMGLVGLSFLSVGVMGGSYAWYRRERPEPVGPAVAPPPVLPLAMRLSVGTALGGICAVVAERLVTQALVLLVCAVPAGVAAVVSHRRDQAAAVARPAEWDRS